MNPFAAFAQLSAGMLALVVFLGLLAVALAVQLLLAAVALAVALLPFALVGTAIWLLVREAQKPKKAEPQPDSPEVA